ncbi:hypothetical protein FE257_010038 [Aspergillus nanangensis]|uniref:Extracellular mutant protein 11 C-terminal domain-containing protein n=1 Tax=Aspergillus nanangensis TaxID=2582783 RepID=A0AAD4CY06_ASPNN|nr:hypothetical protein FE257_010038 [Aspergillus nanangensis]
MGVGDYVHSKEAGQLRPIKRNASNRSRQSLAEQARVEVPTTKLVAHPSLPASRQAQLEHNGIPSFAERPQEIPARRDMFDTDVEGIDDSTIAATSVMGVDDIPYRAPSTINTVQSDTHPHPSHQFEQAHRPFDPKWYENLGDKAFRNAGFGSSDFDDASQLTSMAGDDEASEDMNDSDLHHKPQKPEEPLSKRLQNFWNAGRRSNPIVSAAAHEEPSKIPVATSQPLPMSGSTRKVTLPHSMSATPRTRFSPPKPSLLDKYDLTPTRGSSHGRAQHSKRTSVAIASPHESNEDVGLFANDYGADPMQPLTAFDITHFNDLDDDPVNDPFARRDSVLRISPSEQPHPTKRHLDADYPPEILSHKSFGDLQAEPFDRVPAAPDSFNPARELPADDKMSYLMKLSDQDRRVFFSNLSVEEWEDCGDQIIDEFSKLLTKTKELRQARRRTAAIFEAEIKRRHENVEEQASDLSKKLDVMRTGGVEVLRGRTP